jgi:hypothetical protein
MSEWCSIQYIKIRRLGGIPYRSQFVGSICKKFFERAERRPFFRHSNFRDEPGDVDVEQTYGDHIRQHHEGPKNVGSGQSAATCKIIWPWNTEPNSHIHASCKYVCFCTLQSISILVFCKYFDNIDIKMDNNALKQVSKFKYLSSTIAEDGKNRHDLMQGLEKLNLCLIVNNNYYARITLVWKWKDTYKELYLECCSLWIRNMHPRKKLRQGHKCIWNMVL